MSQSARRLVQPDGNISIEYIRNLEGTTQQLDAIRSAFTTLLDRSNGRVPGVAPYSLACDCNTLLQLLGIQDQCIQVYDEAIDLYAELFTFAYMRPRRKPHPKTIPNGTTPDSQLQALGSLIQESVPLIADFKDHCRDFNNYLGGTRKSGPTEAQLSIWKPYAKYVEANIGYLGKTLSLIPKLDCVRICFYSMPKSPDPETVIETRHRYESADGQITGVTRGPGMVPHYWLDIYTLLQQNFDLIQDILDLGGDENYLSIVYGS